MNIIETKIKDLLIIQSKVFGDARGFFYDIFQAERYKKADIKESFVQDNGSNSTKAVLRGLYLKKRKPQGKLASVTSGEGFDVGVDLRQNFKNFGQYESIVLTGKNKLQFYFSLCFANNFCILSDSADFQYKCTDYCDPTDESGLLCSDLDIDWPIIEKLFSEKDMHQPTYSTIKAKLINDGV